MKFAFRTKSVGSRAKEACRLEELGSKHWGVCAAVGKRSIDIGVRSRGTIGT